MSRPDLSRAAWRKSSRSGTQGNCVELATTDAARVAVRDSKHPDDGALVFTPGTWSTFARATKRGAFDAAG